MLTPHNNDNFAPKLPPPDFPLGHDLLATPKVVGAIIEHYRRSHRADDEDAKRKSHPVVVCPPSVGPCICCEQAQGHQQEADGVDDVGHNEGCRVG